MGARTFLSLDRIRGTRSDNSGVSSFLPALSANAVGGDGGFGASVRCPLTATAWSACCLPASESSAELRSWPMSCSDKSTAAIMNAVSLSVQDGDGEERGNEVPDAQEF